jgi:hypothetical protein
MKLKLPFLFLLTFLLLALTTNAQTNFELRVENESFPTANTYEFDVKLYATGTTTSWEYSTCTYYINMNSAFRNAGTITASIVASTSELNATQIPTSVSYNAANNYIIIGAKTPPGAGAGSIITQSGVRVVRLKLTNTANFSTTAAPNLAWRWATPNTGISAYIGGVNTVLANNTVTAGQKNCKTPNYWNGISWNKGLPLDTTDATIFTGTYFGSLNVRSLVISPSGIYNLADTSTFSYTKSFVNYGIYNGYAVNVQAGANGTVSPSGINYVQTGASIKVIFTPNANYLVDSVIVNGIKVDSISSYTFDSIISIQSIRVTFKPIIYNLNISSSTGGICLPTDILQLPYTSNQTISFIPDSGYMVDFVKVNGNTVDSTNTYTFNNISSDQNIEVTFIKSHQINTIPSIHGNIYGPTIVKEGSSHTYTIIPNTGYMIDSLIIDGLLVNDASNYTFSNINSNHSIYASFKLETYNVSVISNQGGTTSINGSFQITYTSQQTIYFTPNIGYAVDIVKVNGVLVDSVNSYTFKLVSANQTFEVVFVKLYQIKIQSSGSGTISPAGITKYKMGSEITYDFTPNENYFIDQVLLDGVNINAVYNYTFNNINSDHELFVLFKSNIDSASLYINFPTGISYQAVARDSTGKVLANSPIKLKFSIRENSLNGNTIYTETANLTTNKLGLFNCVIGNNNAILGNYKNLDWMGASKFLQIELEQGNAFVLLGTQQLLSVPYANAAKEATKIKNAALPVYNSNSDALQGGLKPGEMYRTPTGVLMIVY